MRTIKLWLLFAVGLLLSTKSASSQDLFNNPPVSTNSNAASYYYLGSREGLTIAVNLWGFVGKPGRYEVPSSTDLVQLISFGGGPLEHAQLDKVRIVRQIMKPDSTYETQVVFVDLQNYQKTGAKTPTLLPGDTIIVPGSSFSALAEMLAMFRDVALIFSGVGTFLLVWRR